MSWLHPNSIRIPRNCVKLDRVLANAAKTGSRSLSDIVDGFTLDAFSKETRNMVDAVCAKGRKLRVESESEAEVRARISASLCNHRFPPAGFGHPDPRSFVFEFISGFFLSAQLMYEEPFHETVPWRGSTNDHDNLVCLSPYISIGKVEDEEFDRMCAAMKQADRKMRNSLVRLASVLRIDQESEQRFHTNFRKIHAHCNRDVELAVMAENAIQSAIHGKPKVRIEMLGWMGNEFRYRMEVIRQKEAR